MRSDAATTLVPCSNPFAIPFAHGSFKSKGKLGLLGGAVSNTFHPYHGDVFIDEIGDLTLDAVKLATKKR